MTIQHQHGHGILFGLGTGRCGTSSLSTLLNGQPDTVCFHELNPSGMAWSGAETTVHSLMRDFMAILEGQNRAVTADLVSPNRLAPLPRLKRLRHVSSLGDVASYYLPYVRIILRRWPEVRFPCLRRDRSQVVESFVQKLASTTSQSSRNHWASPNDLRWKRDPIWDRCFPHFDDMAHKTLQAYVGQYYDMYYDEVERLIRKYPQNIRIFDTTMFNSKKGRSEILAFCLPDGPHRNFQVHANKGAGV